MKKVKNPFVNCETCNASNGVYRWYNKKYECNKCATKSFLKYLVAIGIASIIAFGLIIFTTI